MNVLVCLELPKPSRSAQAALALAGNLADRARVAVVLVGSPAASATFDGVRRHSFVRRILNLEDPNLAEVDALTFGMVLAEAARQVDAAMVLMGERSDEEGTGLIPAALAHHLHATFLARATDVRLVDAKEEVAQVAVRVGGRIWRVEAPLPLVLTTPALARCGLPDPVDTHALPIPSAAVERWTLEQLSLDPSRLVPRSDLLGVLEPTSAAKIQAKSFEQAAEILLRPR